MLSFLKKLIGLPTPDEVNAAKNKSVVISDTPAVNSKTGDLVDIPATKVDPVAIALDLEGVNLTTKVDSQITDSVTQSATKVRKPRKPKTEKLVKEKTGKSSKVVVKKTAAKRSKNT